MGGVPLGFLVQGGCWERRRLVDAGAALRGFAACEYPELCAQECYLSAFHFPDDFRSRADAWHYLNVRDYDGICGADHLHIDIDRPSDLALALSEARRVVGHVLDRYRSLDEEHLLVCYSGSKGFHVDVPLSLFGATPSAQFHLVARATAVGLAERAGVGVYDPKRGLRIDEGVFDRVRLWRAVNSRHAKTGWYKRRLSVEGLMHLTIDRIQKLACAPEPFDVPDPPAIDPKAATDWQSAAVWVRKQKATPSESRPTGGPPRLNRLTREVLAHVGDVGDRHRHLFSAAANLAEFGTVEELIYALLTEPGLDCGLPPKEVARQIQCGIARTRKKEKTDE